MCGRADRKYSKDFADNYWGMTKPEMKKFSFAEAEDMYLVSMYVDTYDDLPIQQTTDFRNAKERKLRRNTDPASREGMGGLLKLRQS